MAFLNNETATTRKQHKRIEKGVQKRLNKGISHKKDDDKK